MKRRSIRVFSAATILWLALACFLPPGVAPLAPAPARAAGYINFESGVDGGVIQSTIPGLEFITTDGQDWLYGDWRTGNYNGKYPTGVYTSNGNFFAWLGPNQGNGRINFTEGTATYLSVWVSAGEPVSLRGYDSNDMLLAQADLAAANIDTGQMTELRIETSATAGFSYAVVSGIGNYWLIDDLSTDAAGVPDTRTPIIFIPGIMGTDLNHNNGHNVWPNADEMFFDPADNSLLVLRLAEDGESAFDPDDPSYTSVTPGEIIYSAGDDIYGKAVNYFRERGYNEGSHSLYLFGYDWRKDNADNAGLLGDLIERVKSEAGVDKVNIIAHSMGGIIARLYIAKPTQAANVGTLVTLGTPYLGAPKAFDVLMYAQSCMVPWAWGFVCLVRKTTMQTIAENFPSTYQLIPGPNLFHVYGRGYIEIAHDTDNDGQPQGVLDYWQTRALLFDKHNAGLAAEAEAVYSKVEDYTTTNGVGVYVIVGSGYNTPFHVREERRAGWWGWGEVETVLDLRPANGDDTVPLHSADLGHSSPISDLDGDVSYFYTKLKHGDLASGRAGRDVLAFALDIFETGAPGASAAIAAESANVERASATPPDAGLLLQGAPTHSAGAAAGPIMTEPIPLSGSQIMVQGAAMLRVQDEAGNVNYITADDVYFSSIPDSSMDRMGGTTSFFVPPGQTYVVELVGEGSGTLDLQLRDVSDDLLTRSTIFKSVPIQPDSRASLVYLQSAAEAPTLAVDMEGDGVVDFVRAPDAVLVGDEIADTLMPVSYIDVDYTSGGEQATITINALDNPGGSGVLRIEYSLDEGRTHDVYSGPFIVQVPAVRSVWAKAVDRAGNEEFPLNVRTVGNPSYLPFISGQ